MEKKSEKKQNIQVSAYNLKKIVFNETETETESQFQCECEFDAVQPKPNGLKVDQSNPGPLKKKTLMEIIACDTKVMCALSVQSKRYII